MSEEIKMSDVFAIPVTGAAVHVNIFQLKGHYNDGKTPFDAIDTAINNHDRLVEENKRLREFLESLQLDVSNEIKLDQLLSELGYE